MSNLGTRYLVTQATKQIHGIAGARSVPVYFREDPGYQTLRQRSLRYVEAQLPEDHIESLAMIFICGLDEVPDGGSFAKNCAKRRTEAFNNATGISAMLDDTWLEMRDVPAGGVPRDQLQLYVGRLAVALHTINGLRHGAMALAMLERADAMCHLQEGLVTTLDESTGSGLKPADEHQNIQRLLETCLGRIGDLSVYIVAQLEEAGIDALAPYGRAVRSIEFAEADTCPRNLASSDALGRFSVVALFALRRPAREFSNALAVARDSCAGLNRKRKGLVLVDSPLAANSPIVVDSPFGLHAPGFRY